LLTEPPAETPQPDAPGSIVPSLTIKKRLAAAPARVWAAWTQPAQLAAWFGPGPTRDAHAEIDLRVGGRFLARFTGENGEQHQVGGLYQEILPERRLVFTWAWHTTPERVSRVTVTLKPDGAGTLLTLLHEKFADATARDNHGRGWSGALAKLAAYVEGRAGAPGSSPS
jgi:uncharacterized protein YndB with AHSA1/START domain